MCLAHYWKLDGSAELTVSDGKNQDYTMSGGQHRFNLPTAGCAELSSFFIQPADPSECLL